MKTVFATEQDRQITYVRHILSFQAPVTWPLRRTPLFRHPPTRYCRSGPHLPKRLLPRQPRPNSDPWRTKTEFSPTCTADMTGASREPWPAEIGTRPRRLSRRALTGSSTKSKSQVMTKKGAGNCENKILKYICFSSPSKVSVVAVAQVFPLA